MSLQVWLPLSGELVNQGLDGQVLTNSNVTLNATNGKIGTYCASFNGSSSRLSATYTTPVPLTQGSLACWAKFNSFPASNAYGTIIRYGNTTGYQNCRLGLYLEYTNRINVIINGSTVGGNIYTHSLSTGVWYHLCATFNGTIVKLYLNGIQVLSKTASQGSATADVSQLDIGGTNASFLNGYLNDVRIYNHCLSVKEVRELSKALVLHYKLDDPYVEGTTNYLTAAGSCANWRNYTASTWATSIDSTCAIGNYVITYSAYIKNNTNVSVRVRCSPLYVAGSYGTIYGNWIAPGG